MCLVFVFCITNLNKVLMDRVFNICFICMNYLVLFLCMEFVSRLPFSNIIILFF